MMVNYRIYIFLAALGAGIIAYSFQPLSFLVVRDKTTGEEIFTQRISPGEKFKLTYIHSVEKIMVTGIFTVDEDNRIILLETYFPSPGTGLPVEARPDRESGQLVLKGINEPREISFFTLSINDYKLLLREYEVLLSPPERDGHIIEILARKRAGIVWMVENLKTRLAIVN
ncbi:DUF1850 domain-containing protein [Candidatus Aerophobetes bacterium]|uniref:DUF1850 domain-containing protein n=1 Tax=Aerophobetes bacterium TaxID=2030807 RepID=A0A523QLH5_UNCAE|nr:MAG: DUF1850 domain-containing protein [Candidatus Aerophobetes bacterium]